MKRTFLWALIGSLSLAASAGVVAILFDGFYRHADDEIIWTLLTVSLFSLTSLGASIVLERDHWWTAMMIALGTSGLGLVLYLAVIWGISHWRYPYPPYYDWIWKAMWVLGVWSVALPHAGLLSLTILKGRYWQWVRFSSLLTILLLAATLTTVVVLENDSGVMIRLIAVLGILTALGTVGVPILSKVLHIEKLERIESTPLTLKLTCPRCELEQTVSNGHSRCARCRLKFRIEIEEPHCDQCGYLLHHLTTPDCPECGVKLAAEEIGWQTQPVDHDP